MPGLFVKHDVDWWDQPAIVQAGELAAVLLQRMECHAQKHLTDGRVPATMLWHWRLPRTQARLDALVAAGLIVQVADAYDIVDWEKHHRTRAEVEALRAKRQEVGKLGGRPKQTETNLVSKPEPTTEPKRNPELQIYRVTDSSPSSSDSRAAQPGPAEADGELELAAELLALAGLVRAEPNPGELRAVSRALANGWPPGDLRAMALQASGALVDPRAYLRQCLVRAINDPPPDAAPAEPRPLLHDQRPPCPNPACVDGNVGGIGPDGRPEPVQRCPDCTGVRA